MGSSSRNFALLPENHRSEARDGAGHRVEAKERVFPHGPPRLEILLSHGLQIDQAPVPNHRRDHAGDVSAVDVFLKPSGHAGEPSGGEPDRFGRGSRDRLGGRGRARRQKGNGKH